MHIIVFIVEPGFVLNLLEYFFCDFVLVSVEEEDVDDDLVDVVETIEADNSGGPFSTSYSNALNRDGTHHGWVIQGSISISEWIILDIMIWCWMKDMKGREKSW